MTKKENDQKINKNRKKACPLKYRAVQFYLYDAPTSGAVPGVSVKRASTAENNSGNKLRKKTKS